MRIKTLVSHITIYLTLLIVFPFLGAPSLQGKEKDTFSISLVQQATVKKIEGREVVCETYTVKDGDYIWKLLRQRGLLKKPNLTQLISLLKSMNRSLTNLDLIHPGQTISIPLSITPIRGARKKEKIAQKSIMGISSLKDVDFENYVVKPGDSLTTVVYGKYKIQPKYLYDEYLNLVQKFNPTLKNLDIIYPNQVIRLPIFSPEIVRMPVKITQEKSALKKSKIVPSEVTEQTISLRKKLRDIFNQMDEEWVDTGKQFIPLKAGGQIQLKAESFPILNLQSGMRLIIDLKNELPEDISQLILADWEDYGVVHLTTDDTLKTALDKIFAASNYYKILKSGEQFRIKSEDIGISISGNWVIIPQRGEDNITEKIAAFSFINNPSEQTPGVIRAYLKKLGIRVIDYPDLPVPKDMTDTAFHEKKISIEKNIEFPLPTLLLNLAGQPFSRKVKIPVYQGKGSEFNLIIQADLFFNRRGKDCIINTTDLSPTIVSLLKKHQFLFLSLAGEKDLNKITKVLLDFLGLSYDSKPHHFLTSSRDEARNITLTVPGISFYDQEGKHILATDKKMPEEIISFLNQKGYTFLELSQFEE
jgi:LysM repeat protein